MLFEQLPLLQTALSGLDARAVLDILIASVLLYGVILFIRETRMSSIVGFIVVLAALLYGAGVFGFTLTTQLLQPGLLVLALVLAVVFQNDIRKFFNTLFLSRRVSLWNRDISITREMVTTIIEAADSMAQEKTGAIIVLAGKFPLDQHTEGGFMLGGSISTPLLLSIFNKESPGHDGAVIIDHNHIRRFGVHLPLAQRYDHFKDRGTRHRAAVGITQDTDALAVIVSEERGQISVAQHGVLKEVKTAKGLGSILNVFIKKTDEGHLSRGLWHYLIVHHWSEKLLALLLAGVLWAVFGV